jgi:transcriptional regulator with XRE-family HTH domain
VNRVGDVGKYQAAPTLAAGLIRLARNKAGITQRELASNAGVSQQAVSEYETGRKEPTLPSLRRLINAAGYEIRMRLEPVDDHDKSLERFLDTLSPDARAEIEDRQRRRVETARMDRVRGR